MTAKSQLGVAEEVTFGTYVAPATFNEFLSESLEYERERIQSQAWRAGQRTASELRFKAGRITGGGAIPMEVANKGMSKWFKHLFGAVAITTPGGGTLSRDHSFTLGDLEGKSLSVQVGKEDRGGVARPFSYLGCKVTRGTFRCALGELLTFEPELIIRDLSTAQSLGVASYPSTLELFSFVEAGTVTIGGTATPVNEFELTVDNRLNPDDFAFGSALRRDVPEPALREVTGTFNADFTDFTAFNRFVNGTIATLVLKFTGSIIEGALNYEVEFTVNIRTDGETPKVDGPDETRQPLRWMALAPAAGEPITMRLRTTDTAV
jgi:hypothetical protein